MHAGNKGRLFASEWFSHARVGFGVCSVLLVYSAGVRMKKKKGRGREGDGTQVGARFSSTEVQLVLMS